MKELEIDFDDSGNLQIISENLKEPIKLSIVAKPSKNKRQLNLIIKPYVKKTVEDADEISFR